MLHKGLPLSGCANETEHYKSIERLAVVRIKYRLRNHNWTQLFVARVPSLYSLPRKSLCAMARDEWPSVERGDKPPTCQRLMTVTAVYLCLPGSLSKRYRTTDFCMFVFLQCWCGQISADKSTGKGMKYDPRLPSNSLLQSICVTIKVHTPIYI